MSANVTATMMAASRHEADRWREHLTGVGFSDDGQHLQGPLLWTPREGLPASARIQITLPTAFPFVPPRARILSSGTPLEPTFHLEVDGTMCLWDDEWDLDHAPWRDPAQFLARVRGWLQQSAAGWPGDDSTDLERYLPADGTFVLYDTDDLPLHTPLRTTSGPNPGTRTITSDRQSVKNLNGARRRHRHDQLAWVEDLGALTAPLRCWDEIAAVIGAGAVHIARLARVGALAFLLLRYTHAGALGVLVVRLRASGGEIEVLACESADTSMATRSLRAGAPAVELSGARVAVVGCGAVGSFAADLLFRSGVRRLTLVDGERLRPGNVVRHLAGSEHVGQWKTHAVRAHLAHTDTDVSTVEVLGALRDLEEAAALVRDHDVVLDATGSARVTSMLATAAEHVGRLAGHSVVSVCVQRDGAVLRVDRMPLRHDETYLPALPRPDGVDATDGQGDHGHPAGHRRPLLRERGCGSPVSPTPPGAVVAAAELAHRVVIDEATSACTLPATIAEVRATQPEASYDRLGRLISAPAIPSGLSGRTL